MDGAALTTIVVVVVVVVVGRRRRRRVDGHVGAAADSVSHGRLDQLVAVMQTVLHKAITKAIEYSVALQLPMFIHQVIISTDSFLHMVMYILQRDMETVR